MTTYYPSQHDGLRCDSCGESTSVVLNCWCHMVVCLACFEERHRQHRPVEVTT